MNALRRFASEERDAHLLGLARVAFGVLLFVQLFRQLNELAVHGYFGNVFHMPIVPAAWVPSEGVFHAALLAECGLALCIIAGIFARFSLFAVGITSLFFLLCDRLQYHNNRYALMLASTLFAFAPCDRSFTLRTLRSPLSAQERKAPRWAATLVRAQLSLIYLSSGGGKLLDADWRGGRVMGLRLQHGIEQALNQGIHVPQAIQTLAASTLAAELSSKSAIATELFLAVGLWFGRTRPFALWLGVMFHLGIELTSRVELFSWLVFTIYLLSVVPELRERRVLVTSDGRLGRCTAGVVRALDWFARFRVEPEPSESSHGTIVTVIDRNGAVSTGLPAMAALARALPLLFPLWAPLFVLKTLTARSLQYGQIHTP